MPNAYPGLHSAFEQSEHEMGQMIKAMARHLPTFVSWNTNPPPQAPAPRWQQGWYMGLDGAALYTLLAHQKPKHYIEIGSGHSTRFAVQSIKDHSLPTHVTCIDPEPRATVAGLPITFHNTIVQNAPLDLFQNMEAGDILFIDSSHIAMPGTDLDFIVGNILPRIPKGVLIHIHDIFLPWGYPPEWTWRQYNEHLVIAALLASRKPSILWSSAYARRVLQEDITAKGLDALPSSYPHLESALWIEW